MEIALFNKEKNTIVRKSNFLIEARYKLTLQEFRIITIVMSMISPADEDFKEYRINLSDVNSLLDINCEALVVRLKEATKGLLKKPLIITTDDKTVIQLNWISSAKYEKGKSYVKIKLDPELKPYLLKIRSYYTDSELKELLSLNSVYSAKIYELLKQYYPNIPKRPFKISDLQEILGCDYPNYGNFKDRVLKSAVLEINNKTGLSVNFEEKKEGRKVEEVIFNIRGKIESANQSGEQPDKDNNQDTDQDSQKKAKKTDEAKQTETDQAKQKIKKKAFTIPTDEELKAYWEKMKFCSDWEEFRDHFNSNGWKVSGKTPMSDWQAAANNWERRHKKFNPDAKPKENSTTKDSLTVQDKLKLEEQKEIENIRSQIKFIIHNKIGDYRNVGYFTDCKIEKRNGKYTAFVKNEKALELQSYLADLVNIELITTN